MYATSNTIPLLDGKITVEQFGMPGRHTVVFVGGWGMDLNIYRERLQSIADFFTVYAVSLPGFGSNPALPVEHSTVHEHADLLASALAELDMPAPYTLLGHSTGAGVAVHFAIAHLDRVSDLVLLQPVGNPDPLHLSWPRVIQHIIETRRRNGDRIRNLNLPAGNWPANLRLAVDAKSLDLFHDMERLAEQVPVHLVLADADLITPPGKLRDARYAHVHLVDGGHDWFAAHPAESLSLLTDLLADHLPTATQGPATDGTFSAKIYAAWNNLLEYLSPIPIKH